MRSRVGRHVRIVPDEQRICVERNLTQCGFLFNSAVVDVSGLSSVIPKSDVHSLRQP